MIIGVYSLKDTKAGDFAAPFTCPNDNVALRLLDSSVNGNHDTDLYKFSSDFELWKLGNLDSKTGAITSELVFLASCADVRRVE